MKLLATSYPPPPILEEITKTLKTSDHEALVESMLLLVPPLFLEEDHISLGRASSLSTEQKRVHSGSEQGLRHSFRKTHHVQDRFSY